MPQGLPAESVTPDCILHLIEKPITFPLCAIVQTKDGPRCGCGDAECDAVGKHPLVLYRALGYPGVSLGECEGWGIKTGSAPDGSGIIAVDADDETAIAWIRERNGGPPQTLTVRTGRGEQYWYQAPPFKVRSSSGELAPKVDVKGFGSLTVGPGSPHKNGRRYELILAIPPAPCPDWLLAWEGLKSRYQDESGTVAYAGDVTGETLAYHTDLFIEYLTKAPPAEQGERDNKLWPIVQKGALDLRLPVRVIIDCLREHYDHKVSPPWADELERRVKYKVQSARTTSTRSAIEPPPLALKRLKAGLLTRAKGAKPGPEAGEENEVKPKFALTDLGNAERFAWLHRDKLRFITAWKSWIVWDETRWVKDDQGLINLLAKEVIRDIERDAFTESDQDKRAGLLKHAFKLQERKHFEAMLSFAKSELSASPNDFDLDPWLLNVQNGTLDLRTAELRPHQREDMLTRLAPVTWDPEAECPLWDKFLNRVMGSNEDLIGYLRRLAGYALTGDTSEHLLVFSHGDGENGKSVFHNTLQNLLGDYATTAPRNLLKKSDYERPPNEMAELFGQRFVLCAETSYGMEFDDGIVKNLVGADKVKARKLFKDFWEFKPTHKLFICGNYKPIVKGQDNGIWRRLRLIPWNERIQAHEKDKHLDTKLAAESSGILTWAVVGCLEWQLGGLEEPEVSNTATAEYKRESDPLGLFFETWCVIDPDAKCAKRTLRTTYESFCRESGMEPVGGKRMFESLRMQGVKDGGTIREKGGSSPVDSYKGIRLKTSQERYI